MDDLDAQRGLKSLEGRGDLLAALQRLRAAVDVHEREPVRHPSARAPAMKRLMTAAVASGASW